MRHIIPILAMATVGGCSWLAPEEPPAPPPTPVHAQAVLEAVPPATARGAAILDGTTDALFVDAQVHDVPEGTYALRLLPPGRCEQIDLARAVTLLDADEGTPTIPTWAVLPEEAFHEGAWLSGTVRVTGIDADEDFDAWLVVVTRENGVPAPEPVSCGRIRSVPGPGV